MKYYLIIILPVLLLAASCRDLGNYDYTEINEMKSVEGIEDTYYAYSKSTTLNISPRVTFSMDTEHKGQYNYEWKIVPVGNTSGEGTVIGREATLTYPVTVEEGDYILYYKIKDISTDVLWMTHTTLKVSSPVSRGFLLIGDHADGYAVMEMIAMPADGSPAVLMRDLLADSGLPRQKGALNVIYTGSTCTKSPRLWFMTDEQSYYVDPKTFSSSVSNQLGSMVFTSFPMDNGVGPIDVAPRGTRNLELSPYSNNNRYIMCNNGYVFGGSISSGEYYQNPMNRYSKTDTEVFPTAPYMMYAMGNDWGVSSMVFYDQEKERFVFGTYSNNYVKESTLVDKEGDLFPWNQASTGLTLKYAENTLYDDVRSGSTFALMSDDVNNVIYKFVVYSSKANKLGFYTVKPIATDFNRASHYAFSSKRTVLFYSVGSTLYAYDYNSGNERVESFGDMGGEITMLKFDIQSKSDFDDLYVATYNTTDQGTLRKFVLGQNPDHISLTEDQTFTWTHLSRIKQMEWRNK